MRLIPFILIAVIGITSACAAQINDPDWNVPSLGIPDSQLDNNR